MEEYCNRDLKVKYEENSSFKELMKTNNKKYLQKVQESLYSDLSKVNKKSVHIMMENVNVNNINGSKIYVDTRRVIYFFSYFQPENQN